MEFKEGQRVKFKNKQEHEDRIAYTNNEFKRNVLFGDTFVIGEVTNHGYYYLITKNGYKFDCNPNRIVAVNGVLHEAEEL